MKTSRCTRLVTLLTGAAVLISLSHLVAARSATAGGVRSYGYRPGDRALITNIVHALDGETTHKLPAGTIVRIDIVDSEYGSIRFAHNGTTYTTTSPTYDFTFPTFIPLTRGALEPLTAQIEDRHPRSEVLRVYLRYRAKVWEHVGDTSQAAVDLHAALELDFSGLDTSTDPYWHHWEVWVPNSEEAIRDCTKLIEFDASDGEAYCKRGFLRVTQGQLDDGIADLDHAIRLDPQNAAAFAARAIAWQEKSDVQKAGQDFCKGYLLNSSVVLRTRAQYAVYTGRPFTVHIPFMKVYGELDEESLSKLKGETLDVRPWEGNQDWFDGLVETRTFGEHLSGMSDAEKFGAALLYTMAKHVTAACGKSAEVKLNWGYRGHPWSRQLALTVRETQGRFDAGRPGPSYDNAVLVRELLAYLNAQGLTEWCFDPLVISRLVERERKKPDATR
jgi:tetratricopeptide (TPR) repeat protein